MRLAQLLLFAPAVVLLSWVTLPWWGRDDGPLPLRRVAPALADVATRPLQWQVVAATDIAKDEEIARSHVALRLGRADGSTGAIPDLAAAQGRIARDSISADTVLKSDMLGLAVPPPTSPPPESSSWHLRDLQLEDIRRLDKRLAELTDVAGLIEQRLATLQAGPPEADGTGSRGPSPPAPPLDRARLATAFFEAVTALSQLGTSAGRSGSAFVETVLYPGLAHLLETGGDAAVEAVVDALKSPGTSSKESTVEPAEGAGPTAERRLSPPVFRDVGFATGQFEVPALWRAKLDELAAYARDHPECRLLIEAHTDTVGSGAANLLLAQRCALEMERRILPPAAVASPQRERTLLIPWGELRPPVPTGNEVPEPGNRGIHVSFAC
jgi:hypothetical protein